MVVPRALKENIYATEFKFNRGLNVFQCHCLVEFRVTSLSDTSRIKLRASGLNIAMEGYVYRLLQYTELLIFNCPKSVFNTL